MRTKFLPFRVGIEGWELHRKKESNHFETSQFLFSEGNDVNLADISGKNVLLYAAGRNSYNII